MFNQPISYRYQEQMLFMFMPITNFHIPLISYDTQTQYGGNQIALSTPVVCKPRSCSFIPILHTVVQLAQFPIWKQVCPSEHYCQMNRAEVCSSILPDHVVNQRSISLVLPYRESRRRRRRLRRRKSS